MSFTNLSSDHTHMVAGSCHAIFKLITLMIVCLSSGTKSVTCI